MALIISLPEHFSSWNLTSTIEMYMCILIIADVYRQVKMSVGTPVGGLKGPIQAESIFKNLNLR